MFQTSIRNLRFLTMNFVKSSWVYKKVTEASNKTSRCLRCSKLQLAIIHKTNQSWTRCCRLYVLESCLFLNFWMFEHRLTRGMEIASTFPQCSQTQKTVMERRRTRSYYRHKQYFVSQVFLAFWVTKWGEALFSLSLHYFTGCCYRMLPLHFIMWPISVTQMMSLAYLANYYA